MANLKPKEILKHTFANLDHVIEEKKTQDSGNSQEYEEDVMKEKKERELEEPVNN